MSIKQFQMTGDVFVVFRAIANSTINGKAFTANEVITSFTGDVTLNYTDLSSLITTNRNQLAKNEVFSDTMTIVPKHLNDGLYDLIGKRIGNTVDVPYIKTFTTNENGQILLNSEFKSGSLVIKDHSGSVVSGYIADPETGIITGLAGETDYKLYYYVNKTTLASLNFEDIHIPYVRIELVGKGNIDNATKSFMVIVPKVQVNSAPQMSFDNESIINIILNCNILGMDKVELHYY
jgi:hypothetical protein